MKISIFAAMTLTTALLAPAVFLSAGGSCRLHGNKSVAEATVSGCAAQRKDALVKSGKLDASWSAVKLDNGIPPIL
jgi:hypothetical protein